MAGFARFAAAGLRSAVVCTMLVLHQASPARGAMKGPCVGDTVNSNPIQMQLVAEPLRLSMDERERFRIGIVATNPTSRVIDPELHHTQLLVNGEVSTAWNDTIGNGRHEDRWFELPPGESVAANWSTLGPILFPAPGTYTLALRRGDKTYEPIRVRVVANRAPARR